MSPYFRAKSRVRIILRRWDGALQSRINSIFPVNQTSKYLLGLGFVALFICFAQFFEQMSFYLQNDFIFESQLLRAFGLLLTLIGLLLLALVALYMIRPEVHQLCEAVDARSKFLGRMGSEIRGPINSILNLTQAINEARMLLVVDNVHVKVVFLEVF